MLTQLITETLLGALTGYVTNHTAIRSLFQPGGVIEQTREEFAREAGRLLEEQVLTQAVLQQQLQLPEVQQKLAQALEAFLQRELPQALQQQKLSALPDSAERAAFLKELAIQFLQQEREQILLLLKKHLPLQQLLTEAQCQRLMKQLEQTLLTTLQQEQFAEQFWRSWRAEKGSADLEQLGFGPLCKTVIDNAAFISSQWPAWIQEQYAAELEQLLLQTIQQLQLRPVLLELDQYMADAVLGQYLRCDGQELCDGILAALKSSEGEAFLAFAAQQLVQALETVTAPASQVIPTAWLETLTPLLQQQMPSLLEEVLNWLEANRQSVEAMLESAVEEVAAEAGGMKGMLLLQLKDSLLQQILQQTDLGTLLEPYFLNGQTSQQTAAALLEHIGSALQEQSLGELVQRWNKKGQLQKILQLLLAENLQRVLEQSGVELAEQLLHWKPGSLRLVQYQPVIEQWLADFLLRWLDKVDAAALLRGQRQQVLGLTVNQLLDMEEQQAAVWLQKLVQQGCRHLAETLPQTPAKDLYGALYDGLEHLVEQRGQQLLQQLADRYTGEQVLALAQPWLFQKQPQILAAVTELGLSAMQGRLSKLAEGQIQQLSEEEMLKLVEDFMGRELQPLNYLGAGMGAVAGATVGTALSIAVPAAAIANPAMLVSVLAGKSAVFGAVGYGTNCAAVKGLFWPYEPVGGIDMLQGVIPKQKERFAHSMGQLVERYVINADVLEQLLRQSQPQWMTYGATLTGDRQRMGALAAEVAAYRKSMAQALQTWLEQQGAAGCKRGLERLGGMPLAFLCGSPLEEGQLERLLLPVLQQWAVQQLQAEIPLSKIVSFQQLWQGLQGWLRKQPLPDLVSLCQAALHSDGSFQQMLSAQQNQALQRHIQSCAEGWLAQENHSTELADWLAGLLEEQRFKQWLAQHGDGLIAQNLSSLFRLVEQTLLSMLQERQEAITAAVQQVILNRLGLMQQMGYSMLGGDEIVAQIVNRLLSQKLPIFLSVKRKELQALCLQCWQQQIFPALLQLPIRQQQVQAMLQSLLAQPVLHRSAGRIAAQAVEKATALPLETWGHWLKLDTLLERIQMQLGFHWQMHGAAALDCWQPLAEKVYQQKLGPLTLRQLTDGFSGKLPLEQLWQCEGLHQLLRGLQLRLQENISITRLQQWLDWPQAAAVLEQGWASLLADGRFQQWLGYESELLVLQLTAQWERLLPEDSRTALLQPMIQAAFAVAEEYGVQLLAAMDLSRLAERQLIAMDSAHLETVVRGFASQYLVHIENRGWLGAAFALPGMLLYLL